MFFPYRPKKRNVPNDKRAKTDYQSDAKLSGVAKRLYRQYKKLFDEFAERNFQNNATEAQNLKKPVTSMNQEIMHVTDKPDVKAVSEVMAYRHAIDPDLMEFVDSVSAMESKSAISKRKHTLGKISEKHAKIVEDVLSSELGLNIDAGGYTVNIDGSAVKHIEEKHGANGSSDHSMQSKADVARIGWAVNNADSGHIARTQMGEIDYSTQYRNADGSPSPKIVLEKSIGDGKFIVAECVPDTTAKKIHIISARKIKSGNGQVLNVKSNDSPQPTSETLLDGITATDSITETEKKSNPSDENSSEKFSEKRFALIGRTEDRRGIYRTNYPENTPKDVKQKDIVDLVQNVWSKKPIKLNLIVDGKEVPIEARFNPELTERSDLSKIAFGNRKGTASEKRITMNLSSDLYQIAEESHHVGSKTESGKDNAAHAGVTTWHYFLTDLVYVEADGTEIECYMNIDVKQNDSGHWFYSFAIEKGSRPADVLSVVTDKSATTSTISITENAEKSNPSDENSSEKFSEKRFALPETDSEGSFLSPEQREFFADTKVLDENGNLMVMYHGTPNGTHTTFRSGSYFTPDAAYADKYQNPGASTLSTGKTASNPKTYKVYLNITKPFDTRNATERDIFRNEYYRKYGTGAPLSESGLPDWTDGMDLQEFIEEMGYDYDGLILDEGGTGGYGDEVVSRGLSYVTFSSEQVKDVDNKNPSVNKDIRYALDAESYSYDTLTKKPDLSVVTFPKELPLTEDGSVDTNAVVARGRLNARKQKNPNNTDERTYVHVGDIGLDVLLSKKGMVHGIARSQETAFAVMKIGDVLKNSVAMNELNGSAKRKAEMSYVLLGACRDSENLYVVRSVVSKVENDVTEIDVYQLSAVKGKKTETPTSALGGTGVKEQNALVSSESPIISIADFLEYVKTIPLANEVFSEDVAKKVGVERSKGSLSGDLRYALSEVDSEGNTLTEDQQELFKDSKVRDSKGRLLVMYHGTTANFNTFKKGDVGFHFGTKATARGRVGYGKNAIMKRVHLNITNPIVFEEDLGSWDADYRLTQELFERDILTREEVEQVLLSDDRSYRRPTEKANRRLAELLLQKGYDGIAYSNTFETKKPTTSYIAFQSNQAKLVENEAPTANPDIRYALDNTEKTRYTYTAEQYEKFGWAREADAITKDEADDLYSKIQESTTMRVFKKSSNGEAIVEVNKKPNTTLDVDNVFVFVKGTKTDFRISRVVRFAAETETEMEILREDLYEGRTCSDTHIALYQEKGLAREYRRENFPAFAEYSAERSARRTSNGTTGRGADQDHRGRKKYGSGYHLHVGEDGEITESFGKRYALSETRGSIMTEVDPEYEAKARRCLFGELSTVLGIPFNEIEAII